MLIWRLLLVALLLFPAPWQGCLSVPAATGPDHSIERIVVLSAAYAALPKHYAFVLPIAAMVWQHHGWRPLVVMVGDGWDSPAGRRMRQEVEALPRVLAYQMPSPTPQAAIPLSQCVRLFAALLPGVPPAAYLRVTDADMLITNTSWLLPHNTAGVDVFNGRCCLELRGTFAGRQCRQVPMHAIGMTAARWRALFAPLLGRTASATLGPAELTPAILTLLEAGFGYRPHLAIKHGGKFWDMDQLIAGCVLLERWSLAGPLSLRVPDSKRRPRATDPKARYRFPETWRLHRVGSLWTRDSLRHVVDIHLHAFTLDTWPWVFDLLWRAPLLSPLLLRRVHRLFLDLLPPACRSPPPPPAPPRVHYAGAAPPGSRALASAAAKTWARGPAAVAWRPGGGAEPRAPNASAAGAEAALWAAVWAEYPAHDWYVLVRPGTYVFPTRLHAALQRRRPGRPVAVGAVGRPAAGQADTLARGLVALSSGALAKLSQEFGPGFDRCPSLCRSPPLPAYPCWLECLGRAGVTLVDECSIQAGPPGDPGDPLELACGFPPGDGGAAWTPEGSACSMAARYLGPVAFQGVRDANAMHRIHVVAQSNCTLC